MSGLRPAPVGEMNPVRPPALPAPSVPPPLAVEHGVRVSALEPARVWKIDGDTLWMITEGQPDIAIPLAGIQEVRLAFEPSRMQTKRFRCYLYRSGIKVAAIQNEHYKGFASFEDRSESYNVFVRLLIPRIASLNPCCVFKTGTSELNWWAQAVIITFVGVFLLLTLVFLYAAIGPLVVIKLLIIAFFIPTLVRWFKRNMQKSFSPDEIPEGLLPEPIKNPEQSF